MRSTLLLFMLSVLLFANEARILDVKVIKKLQTYSFAVTIIHDDSGWDHYVDGYEVLDAKGNVLAKRTLWHPHEHEQPFTRSLNDVTLSGLTQVYLRAHDSVDGYSQSYEVTLP